MKLTPKGRQVADEAIRRYAEGESIESIANDLTDGNVDGVQFLVALAGLEDET